MGPHDDWVVGENTAVVMRGVESIPVDALQQWFSEHSAYEFQEDRCYSNEHDCSRYTQVR